MISHLLLDCAFLKKKQNINIHCLKTCFHATFHLLVTFHPQDPYIWATGGKECRHFSNCILQRIDRLFLIVQFLCYKGHMNLFLSACAEFDAAFTSLQLLSAISSR